MKKGIFFTLDALFATILIGIALIISSKYYISDVSQSQVNYYSQDIVNSLSNIKISEVNDSYVKSLISSGEIVNLENSVVEQIGEFYVLNKTDLARNLSVAVSKELIPDKFGFEMLVNDESIYFVNSEYGRQTELISSRRLISGIEKFKPIKGATSKVFLQGINRKKYSSYAYFGGFIGQGNLSGFIDTVPQNVNISGMYLELDAASDFEFFLNNIQCDSTFSVGTGMMTADGWDIGYCNSSLILGQKNNYTVIFSDQLGTAYIGGGFLRVDYYTDELQQEKQTQSIKEYLTGVNGIINTYSSFYVPGSLTNISVFLHYKINTSNQTKNTFYFTIGNATVFKDNNLTGEKTQIIYPQNITKYYSLSSLDRKTVPIRAGFENVSFGFLYEGNADVIIITDVSGSMDWRMDNNNNGVSRNCDDALINDSSTRRISIAKCLDKQFVRDILNITGNRVGLVSYDDVTHAAETRYPTLDTAVLDAVIGTSVPETGYEASGSTCICCGINSAVNAITENISATTLIARNSNWLYNNFSLVVEPGQDSNGNNWYDISYLNESEWFSGNTILGATNSYNYLPAVDTEIGSSLVGLALYANLWENNGDTPGPPNDFSSGILNLTANTYGIAGNNDGWDWDTANGAGPFGYDDDIDYNNIVAGVLELDSATGAPARNRCNNNDCSGAYGISVNITQEMFDTMQANGAAIISFWYQWHEQNGNPFESSDEAWIKARWTSPSSGQHYLGSNLDATHSGNDADLEIAAIENPDTDVIGTFTQELSSWIESPGTYYLELGGKVLANANDEWGYWRFDNIQISFSNSTDHYYFRKNFSISDLGQVGRGILNVLSDDMATVYINGIKVTEDTSEHNATYWNIRGRSIPSTYFNLGNNVIAVELHNFNYAAKFDLELIGLNDSKDRAIMVMTDGQANVQCAAQGTGSAINDAILAACNGREDYGITFYAVGYSTASHEGTLQGIALCGEGVYARSENVTVLREFYQDVASSIISGSRHAQTIEIQGNISTNILYDDSYIQVDYIPIVDPPQFGEISLIVEEKNFDNCSFNVYIPTDIRVSNAKLTSYSSEHWTDGVVVNNNGVYNLSIFSRDYTAMGDPFLINIPATVLIGGNNSFFMRTGDSPDNNTECSKNNTFIYTAQVQASVSYSDVLEKAIGCEWFVEFDDGENISINVPPTYSGAKKCYYTTALIDYDANDTYDDAMFNLLDNLDFDDDGRIYVNIKEQNLIVGAISVGKVPYPWGPAISEVRVWR